MFKAGHTISACLLLFAGTLTGQNDSLKNIDYFLENVINTASIEKENSQLYDLIEYYLENPISLNNATRTELMKLPLLSVDIVNELIKYRNKVGRVFSYNELLFNTLLKKREINILKAFTYLTPPKKEKTPTLFKNFTIKLRSRIRYNLQESEGFKSGYYKGDRNTLYNRIQIRNNSLINMGGLIEKDAGDKSYFDFYSYYLQINNLIKGINFLFGFYTVEFGQGLAMWSPYALSKSSDATNTIIKRARGITPYTSAGEYRYLKGTAAEYSSLHFSLSPFYSDSIAGIFSRISPIRNLNFSFLYYRLQPFKGSRQKEYFSTAYNFSWNNLFLTGEIAFFGKTVANINTFQLSLLKKFLLVASIRNYGNNYNCYYGTGFGESGHLQNEFGIYFGFKWKTQIGTINFYFDQFKFPQPSKNIPLSGKGSELSASVLFPITENSSLFLRYFSEQKEITELINKNNEITSRQINKLRSEFLYNPDKKIKLKTRIEIINVISSTKKENGILLFQDLHCRIKNNFSFYGRIIFFDTDGFSSRIYEFENDLTGIMNNRPLWGKGIKWYLLLKYMLINRLYLSAKYSELYKPEENFLGSGYNVIEGNIDNNVSVQIDYFWK
jgi:hypothetical protein